MKINFYRDPLAQARLSLRANPPRVTAARNFVRRAICSPALLAGSLMSAASRSRRIIFVVNRYSELAIRFITEYLAAAAAARRASRGRGESERRRLSRGVSKAPRASPQLRSLRVLVNAVALLSRRIPNRFREVARRYTRQARLLRSPDAPAS